MAYDKNKIFQQAKEMIVKHNLFFVEDIVAFLPISKPTFYDYFKPDSNDFNELRELLEVNRTTIKVSLRKKWYDSDNATLQMGLMKLIASPEEHRRLSQTHQEHSGEIKTGIAIENLTTEELIQRAKAVKELNDKSGA
jgi:hypothetical protein